MEGENANVGQESLEPGTPTTSPSRTAEESLPVPDVHAENYSPSLDLPALDANGEASGLLTVNILDTVVDNIVETAVNSIGDSIGDSALNSSLTPDRAVDNVVVAQVSSPSEAVVGAPPELTTRSPSLDPWLKPNAFQPSPALGSLPWQAPASAWSSGQWVPPPVATSLSPGIQRTPETSLEEVEPSQEEDVVKTTNGDVVPLHPSSSVPAVASDEAEAEVSPEKAPTDLGETLTATKKRARARERKTPASKTVGSVVATPRSRAGKKAVATPASPPSVETAVHLGDVYTVIMEGSAVPDIVQPASPITPLSPSLGDRSQGLGRTNLHDDTVIWVEQARVSFEEALSAANSAHEQVQLIGAETTRSDNGDNTYASAAAAVSAAASVAKAAAEAARFAYEAALQARLFYTDGTDTNSGKSPLGSQAELERAKESTSGGRRSAIAAAREQARKRAPSSSSGKIAPQSTDAVLRAAQLMAEAATHAGAVLAKGNSVPFVLSQFPQTGLNGDAEKGTGKASAKKRLDSKKVKASDVKGKGAVSKGKPVSNVATPKSVVKGKSPITKLSSEKPTRRHLEQSLASTSHAGAASELNLAGPIVEGSFVEVMSDEEGLRGGWFSGRVIQMKGGQAYVQYDDLLTDDGISQLQEWFSLKSSAESSQAHRPMIRLSSPNSLAKDEGKRKRARTALGDQEWIAGDPVDAFVEDGWWEGIVKAVDEDDKHKVTVHFPGEGDTSVIKSWNLRLSHIWKDGKWVVAGRPHHAEQENIDLAAKRQKLTVTPKAQTQAHARKSVRKSKKDVKESEEATELERTGKKKMRQDQVEVSETMVAPVVSRSPLRQKIPPKRKTGTKIPTNADSKTSSPDQAQSSMPVSTRARSSTKEVATPDVATPSKEPSKVAAALKASVSSKKLPSRGKVVEVKKAQSEKGAQSDKVLESEKVAQSEKPATPAKSLRNGTKRSSSPVPGTQATRQKVNVGASLRNRKSSRH